MYKRINQLLGTDLKSDKDIDWAHIATKYYLSDEFLEEFKNTIDWNEVSAEQILSRETLRKFKDKVDWEYVSMFQELDLDSLIEFSDLIHWQRIVECQILKSKDIYYNLKEYLKDFEELILLEQPFIIPENHDKQLLNKCLTTNTLYHLYQQTKNRGWFVGYVNVRKEFIKSFPNKQCLYLVRDVDIKIRQLDLKSRYLIIKSKIYWKDIKLKFWTNNYNPIRLTKFI